MCTPVIAALVVLVIGLSAALGVSWHRESVAIHERFQADQSREALRLQNEKLTIVVDAMAAELAKPKWLRSVK